jgi:hypothetical protein
MDSGTVVKLADTVKTRKRRRPRPVTERVSRKASQLAISKASQAAATALATLNAMPATPVATPETAVARNVVTGPWVKKPEVEVKVPRRTAWTALGRIGVGAAIVATGAFIAFTSMRANSWFGHALTPDPAAGDIQLAGPTRSWTRAAPDSVGESLRAVSRPAG